MESQYRMVCDNTVAGAKFYEYLDNLILETIQLITNTDSEPKAVEVRWDPKSSYLNIVDENNKSIKYGFGLTIVHDDKSSIRFAIIGHLANIVSSCLDDLLTNHSRQGLIVKFDYIDDWESTWSVHYNGLIFKRASSQINDESIKNLYQRETQSRWIGPDDLLDNGRSLGYFKTR